MQLILPGRGLVDRKLVEAPPSPPPVILLLAGPRRLFCFGSLVVLDVGFRYLSLCLLSINTKIGKLDYQVSIRSLIPPATAISKTQDRVDTNVWWKWPFSIFFIIYYVQRAIINKVCKPELWFLCSVHPIIVLYICMKFHENIY